jgi:eukaryotic-like serine/threonine-protein kinase
MLDEDKAPTHGSESEAPPETAGSLIGGKIGGVYRVEELLGTGTMGIVFLARDVRLDRPVAIKLMDERRACDGAIRRFRREARTLAQARHENVVQVFALGAHDGDEYIVMEYVEGRSLETIIEARAERGTTVPLDDAFGILRRVSAGLAAVHASGLVHRDVKPSNIMIEEGTGRPVLIDFGLARRIAELNPAASLAGGTPCYMAPEQVRDPAAAGPPSDIYALACTAFELFTGRCPFVADDLISMLLAHAEKPPPRISSFRHALAPFDALFARALSKLPGDRHQSCKLFIDELDMAACDVQANRSGAQRSARADSDFAPREATVRVLVFQRPDGLRRNVVRLLTTTLGAAGDRVAVECVDSEWALLQALTQQLADIVLFDDDKALGRTEEIVEAIRRMPGGDAVEVIVLARDISEAWSRLGRHDAVGVPKPVSMQVLRSVVARLGRRIVERRSWGNEALTKVG